MSKKATIHRLVTPDHLCPWGIKAIDLLRRAGFEIEDKHLESSEENKAFREAHGVSETPQVWIEGERIGGYDELRAQLETGLFPLTPTPSEPMISHSKPSIQ